MTKEEFYNLNIKDKYYLLYGEDNEIASFQILSKLENGYKVEMALNGKTRNHYAQTCHQFQLSPDLCKIELLKERIKLHNENKEKYLKLIENSETELDELKESLKCDELLEKYPEEFI